MSAAHVLGVEDYQRPVSRTVEPNVPAPSAKPKAYKKITPNAVLVRKACMEVIEDKAASRRDKLRAAALLAGLVKLGKAKPRGKAVGRSDVTKGNIRELLSAAASSPAVRQETE